MTAPKRKPAQSEGGNKPEWTGTGVPDWMAKFGIKPSEWLSVTKAQIRTQMRPDRPLKVQLWACGILHTAGYKGELAQTKRNNKLVNFTPAVAIREIHQDAIEYYRNGGVVAADEEFLKLKETKEDVRSAFESLEEDGLCVRKANGKLLRDLTPEQRQRLPSGSIEYYFYLTPEQASPANVRKQWARVTAPPSPPPSITEGEVGKSSLPPVSISQVLKTFGFERPKKEVFTSPDYQKRVVSAWLAAKKLFDAKMTEVGTESLPVVGPEILPEVGTGGGAFESKDERIGALERKRAQAAPEAVHHHQPSLEEKGPALPLKKSDDEKPKPLEDGREYLNAREELKAIYQAKAHEPAEVRLLNQLEGILGNKGHTFEEFLEKLRPHLPNEWRNPAGFLTDFARKAFLPPVEEPALKPKPKCPRCRADNQRGAILEGGKIVPCPDCSTDPAWREELEAKEAARVLKSKGAGG